MPTLAKGRTYNNHKPYDKNTKFNFPSPTELLAPSHPIPTLGHNSKKQDCCYPPDRFKILREKAIWWKGQQTSEQCLSMAIWGLGEIRRRQWRRRQRGGLCDQKEPSPRRVHPSDHDPQVAELGWRGGGGHNISYEKSLLEASCSVLKSLTLRRAIL